MSPGRMGQTLALALAALCLGPVLTSACAVHAAHDAPAVAGAEGPPPDARLEAGEAGLLELTPAGGLLGEQPFFALRGAYTISSRLAVEAEIGHNVGDLVSAYLHSAGVRVTAARYRGHAAFGTAGFGTFSAAGGDAIAAQDITRSHFWFGGGIAYRLRDDVGIRLDLRHHRVLLGDGGADHGSSLGANEASFGLTFSRRIWSPPPSSGRSAS